MCVSYISVCLVGVGAVVGGPERASSAARESPSPHLSGILPHWDINQDGGFILIYTGKGTVLSSLQFDYICQYGITTII